MIYPDPPTSEHGQYYPIIWDPDQQKWVAWEGQVKLTGTLAAIKGQYGDALIPVQVDAEGRIVLAADVIVDAEGLVIDATQMGQGPAGTEPWLVKLQSNAMEYYGATANERPAVADVPVGAVYMAVQTQELWQSDGAEWVVM